MELKETLQIGKTEFPMRAGLAQKEPQRQKEWEENKVYERRQEINEGKPTFVLHDGPPFANGNIHIGHAMNQVSKDIIVRSKSMMGYRSPYVPGWDTHGLPVEQRLADMGVDRKTMTTAEYRKLCYDFAMEQVELQKADFKRLGASGEWDNPYITLTPDYEAAQVRVFGKMAEKGYIYRGLKPIYWSPSSESALAEAEIEYKDVRSPSIYVAFDVVDGKGQLDENTSLVIWTTTPWTIPANLAVAVAPKVFYSIVQYGGQKYVLAEDLVEKVTSQLGWEDYEVQGSVQGSDLEYVTTKHPLYDRESLVILGDHVTLDEGTGLVHTAPGHGEDDYFIGQEYDLGVLSPVDGEGKFTEEAPGFEGVFYDDANKMITEKLEESGHLLKLEFITHSYPHDWRTKKPVIYRATPQWFASIDKFRDQILESIKEVVWHHPYGEARITDMVENRGDWVISRQRAWGVPLPIFYGEDGSPIITPETISHISNLFEEHGSNIWFEWEAKDLLPEGFTHESSPNGAFTKEEDIMDVWFDSGSSHEAVLRGRDYLTFPADMYLEGSDQYRGWFNSSLTTSVAVNGTAPYRSVLSQGFVLDGDGKKMSKSLGNVIAPNEITETQGADIIRLWVSSVDYRSDVRVSHEILNQVSESYRKIRNTLRYMIANTEDFQPQDHAVPYDELRPVDQYLENRLQEVTQASLEAYDEYNFQGVYQTLTLFIIQDLSNFYLDFAKDVVYIDAEDGYERRCMQTVMYHALVNITKLLTPIIPHTTEEVWTYLKEEEDYVQLADMPDVETYENSQEILAAWNRFMDLRDAVNKSLENARNDKLIGKSFEAKVTLYLDDEGRAFLDSLNSDLRQVLIVSELVLDDLAEAPDQADDYDQVKILVEEKSGGVCERCRIISESVGTHEDAPELCDRCYAIVRDHYPEYLEAK